MTSALMVLWLLAISSPFTANYGSGIRAGSWLSRDVPALKTRMMSRATTWLRQTSPVTGKAPAQAKVVMASGALQRCLGITPGQPKIGPRDPRSCQELPASDLYDQAGRAYGAGDRTGAATLAMRAAQAGNPLAQLRLAIMYEKRDGVSEDARAAFMWYSRAASVGEPASQAELGGYYEQADGVPEDWDLAAQLYQASAMQGWSKGQLALGRAYEFGIGVPQNRQQAIAWFAKAGAQGLAQGSYSANWLRSPLNNIGFRNQAEHDLVIGGKLRFGLLSGDPAGIAFHSSSQRAAWLTGQRRQIDVGEAHTLWQLQKNEYDECQRNKWPNCIDPGRDPARSR